jgi:hypothetical protein
VQRWHDTDPFPAVSVQLAFLVTLLSSTGNGLATGKSESRLAEPVAALIAALRTVVNGGLMPHARHGGRFIAGVAVAVSKFEGTGLENVHIGQIQVALIGFGEGDGCGAAD